jgi:hypothetical protein
MTGVWKAMKHGPGLRLVRVAGFRERRANPPAESRTRGRHKVLNYTVYYSHRDVPCCALHASGWQVRTYRLRFLILART